MKQPWVCVSLLLAFACSLASSFTLHPRLASLSPRGLHAVKPFQAAPIFSRYRSSRAIHLKQQNTRVIGTKMQLDPTMIQEGVLLAASLQDQVMEKVTTLTMDDIAGGLFAFSLFPYLGFLYHLGRPENKTPELGLFGFKFLLAFVGVSIPAAIAAKVLYGAQLADVDYLHGGAESFLTLTNLFIVLGFRRAVSDAKDFKDDKLSELLAAPAATALAVTLSGLTMAASVGGLHPEPGNALSLPTWMVHVSSLIEWLAAMGLVWRYAAISGNPRWKGLTWGMLPFHSSGICACTYHVFYNAPPVSALVALQSLLTVVGDMTCWYAAYRIYLYAKDNPGTPAPTGTALAATDADSSVQVPTEGRDSEGVYLGKLLALTFAGAVLVKWGELTLDFPFKPDMGTALACILVPTSLNVITWLQRSEADSDDFSEFY